ncbi:MAG TPA: hypothetical protein VKN35_07960 [Xanthomonadales bacterium]|nr:hypothetical protein [Xanthomonadales bacterium]
MTEAKNSTQRDYGRHAHIGVLTPQANPTVEPELGLLFPAGVSMLTTRCTSKGAPRQRLLDYIHQAEQFLETFDTLELDAAAFACTASSYLLEPDEEDQLLKRLEERFGYPMITASAAIGGALNYLGAERIALACPYPEWLHELSQTYWKQQGFHIAASLSVQPEMGDTRAIYDICGSEAGEQIATALEGIKADVIVITGTGMPALKAIVELQDRFGVPVFNSNLALAWSSLRAAGVPLNERSPDQAFPLLGGWAEQLGSL